MMLYDSDETIMISGCINKPMTKHPCRYKSYGTLYRNNFSLAINCSSSSQPFEMIKSASRSLFRSSIHYIRPSRPQRLFSTEPPSQRSRSWKNSVVRWGLALGGIYYYNTSNVFAEEPVCELSFRHLFLFSFPTTA